MLIVKNSLNFLTVGLENHGVNTSKKGLFSKIKLKRKKTFGYCIFMPYLCIVIKTTSHLRL